MNEYKNIVEEVEKYPCVYVKENKDYKHDDVKKEHGQQQEKSC